MSKDNETQTSDFDDPSKLSAEDIQKLKQILNLENESLKKQLESMKETIRQKDSENASLKKEKFEAVENQKSLNSQIDALKQDALEKDSVIQSLKSQNVTFETQKLE